MAGGRRHEKSLGSRVSRAGASIELRWYARCAQAAVNDALSARLHGIMLSMSIFWALAAGMR
jgi:hypothetical protein